MKPFHRSLGIGLVTIALLGGPVFAQGGGFEEPTGPAAGAGVSEGARPCADGASGGRQRDGRSTSDKGQRAARRMQRLKVELGLSDAQVEQLKPIFRAQRERVQQRRQAMREQRRINGTLTDEQRAQLREARLAQRAADRQALFAQTRSVLTPEQEAKFEQLLAQRAARGRGPHGPGGLPSQGAQTPH